MTKKHAAAALTLALALLATPKAYPTDIPVMDGAGLTVTAELTKPGTVRVDRDDIDRSTAPDLVSLLAETAGVSMTSHGGYGTVNAVSIRGLSTSRIQVRIDGVLVSSPS